MIDRAETAMLSTDAAATKQPKTFIKLSTHDQQFFSTFFNKTGMGSRQTGGSFFDYKPKQGANLDAPKKRPQVGKKRSDGW